MTETTQRRIRIESNLDTDKKTHALHHTRVYIDDQDVTADVIAIDWHADAHSIPTATIQLYSPALTAEAAEAEPGETNHGEHVTDQPENPAITELRDQITQLAAQNQQLQQLLIQVTAACATCLTEERQGTRQGHNLANTIIDGTAYCNEHLDVASGRLVPRKSSGIIVTGG